MARPRCLPMRSPISAWLATAPAGSLGPRADAGAGAQIRIASKSERPLAGHPESRPAARHGGDREPAPDADRRRRGGGAVLGEPARPPRTTSPPRSCSNMASRSAPGAARTSTPTPATSSAARRAAADHDRRRCRPPGHCAPAGRRRLDGLLGGTEETTTGLVRLRRLDDEGQLRCPVLAVNEARTERALNDRHGTGQSAIDGIIRASNVLLAGHTLVVMGYGWAGQGWPSAPAAPAPRSSSARWIRCARSRRGWQATRSCRRWPPPSAATSSSPSPARAGCCAASTSSG